MVVKSILSGGVALIALALSNTAARAEADTSQAQADAPSSAREIVVTAQKRSQKLNDVGITITAATAGELKTAGVASIDQLSKIATGFTVGTSFVGFPVFSIRGVNFNAPQFSAGPAVSTYVDEAILPFAPMTGALLLDVDHIEVLKGPQGTLFGQNSTGGSINVVAAKPTLSFKAGFNGEVNHFGETRLEGFISGPVSSNLSARLAASTTQFGAWQKGYSLNKRKNGDENKAAARLLLDWTPTDRLTVAVNINASYDHGEGIQAQLGSVAPQNPANAVPGLVGYKLPNNNRDADIDATLDTHRHNRLYQGALRVEYALTDAINLTSLTNYVDFKSRRMVNLDATALPILHVEPIGNDKTFSQELRLSGKALDNRLNFVMGANYQHDKIVDGILQYYPGYSTLPPGAEIDNVFKPTNRSIGAFASADFNITSQLNITAGLRYTETKQTVTGCSFGNGPAAALFGFIANVFRGAASLPPTDKYVDGGCLTINDSVPVASNGNQPDFLPMLADAVQKENNLSWRAGINYKPDDDNLVYALVSRGYKAGAFPVQANVLFSTFVPVKQEQLTSFEVGTKLVMLDRKVRLNLSAFYYKYKDKQFFTYLPLPIVGSGSVVVNVPKSSVKGIDAEITLDPSDNFTFRGAMTYIKTKVGEFSTYDFLGNFYPVTGSEFNFAPPFSATFDAEYHTPINDSVQFYIGGGGLYEARTFGNLGMKPETFIPNHLVLDARIGLRSDKGWRAGLFVRNLTDDYYWTSVIAAGDTNAKYAGIARTFGVTFGFDF